MRNWEQEQIEKKLMLTCYISPECKERVKALARERRMSISQVTRELVELSLPILEARWNNEHGSRP
jgi:hypothetical protein